MSDELDGLLRASVRAEAPDWLEQLVTERAVACVESEASSFGATSRRVLDGLAGLARETRRRAWIADKRSGPTPQILRAYGK